MPQLPWEVTPALTEDRLRLIVDTIARVRADAREGHLPEKGDDAWVFGCRAYRRTCHALMGLMLSGDYPWLLVRETGLACTVLFEDVPIKFYCGDPESPSPRSLERGFEATFRQEKLGFYVMELNAEESGWFWLLALEKHEDGSLMQAVVLQASSQGQTRNLYFLPVDSPVPVVGAVTREEREGVNLPPPLVGPRGADGKSEASGGDQQRNDRSGEEDRDDDDRPEST